MPGLKILNRSGFVPYTVIKDDAMNHNEKDVKYIQVRVLGISGGASSPSFHSAGIYISNGTKDMGILLDCGQDTSVRLMEEGIDPNYIVAIFISHAHIDHFIGLPVLVLHHMMFRERKNTVFIYAPSDVIMYLKPLFDNYSVKKSFSVVFIPLGKNDTIDAGDFKVSPFPVDHVLSDSFGFKITDGHGKKIVYSGDTMPCQNLIIMAGNADLLIHDATFASNFELNRHGHSRIEEAVDVAIKANVSELLLTHLSLLYHESLKEYVDDVERRKNGFGGRMEIASEHKVYIV